MNSTFYEFIKFGFAENEEIIFNFSHTCSVSIIVGCGHRYFKKRHAI